MDSQATGVLHTLFGKVPDVSHEFAPHPLVQIMSGYPAIDLNCSNNRLVNFDAGHPDQPQLIIVVP